MTSNRLQQLLGFLEASPKDSFILFAIAKEYEKYNEDKQALNFYLKLRESDPNYVGLYYHLGKLYEKKQAYETALEAYETGISVAREQGDQHALGELAQAKMILEEDFL